MKIMLPQFFLAFVLLFSCTGDDSGISDQKKKYWYNNEAEITSYELTQARYGEMHSGKAVLVFVTEPFSQVKNTKSDSPSKEDVSVLKLNFTKKFNTGIYPYSLMTSTFFPFEDGVHSLKISSSSQEWCGHTFMELKNKDKFEIDIMSYFEDQSVRGLKIEKDILEDDIWSMIRLSPNKLPIGKMKVIPSFFNLRLMHKETKAYPCELNKSKIDETFSNYTIYYPELKRTLSIVYESKFPHKIDSWTETFLSGFGNNQKELKTTATKMKTIKSDYWNKHSNIDSGLRKTLGLD